MGVFNILTTVIKTASKEMAENRKLIQPQWKYDALKREFNPNAKLFQNSNYPQLKGSDELWPLTKSAIDNDNVDNALKVVDHIRRFRVHNIDSYKVILRTINKAFKEIDISDLL